MTRQKAIDEAVRRSFAPYMRRAFLDCANRLLNGGMLPFDYERIREIRREFERVVAETA